MDDGPVGKNRDVSCSATDIDQRNTEIFFILVQDRQRRGQGLENQVYYMLANGGRHYRNYSGCGNTLNGNHPVVREMIFHCLRHWVHNYHVDGFRFDLASILSRDRDGNLLPNPPVVYVDWLFEWYNPPKAKQMAETFITQYGCDVIAFTEDSTAVVEACEDYYVKYTHGEWPWPVYTFAHYSPMLDHGPDVVVSGQLVHWEVIYEDIVMKVALGVYTPENLENVDYWWMLREGAVELGCDYGVPINPEFEDDLRAVTVTDKLTGQSMSVYDLVMLRLAQMSEEVPTFDPFTGPLYDQNGNLRVPEGVRLGHDDLWTMMWFVEWVVGTIPS